ncbi:hypothetical protein KAU33_02485 [Candidatus Dependentiae bacterium]|nr:hypothetical protein [Candidatus Dependentiae bacterium]
MKFEIGEAVFHDWIGCAEKVEIIKCYPKTNRYRIQHEKNFQLTVKASEIFRTEKELWQSKLNMVDNRIRKLEKLRDEYKKNIYEAEE